MSQRRAGRRVVGGWNGMGRKFVSAGMDGSKCGGGNLTPWREVLLICLHDVVVLVGGLSLLTPFRYPRTECYWLHYWLSVCLSFVSGLPQLALIRPQTCNGSTPPRRITRQQSTDGRCGRYHSQSVSHRHTHHPLEGNLICQRLVSWFWYLPRQDRVSKERARKHNEKRVSSCGWHGTEWSGKDCLPEMHNQRKINNCRQINTFHLDDP